MKNFKYTGVGKDGKKVVDKIAARDIQEARKKISTKKIKILELKETKGKSKESLFKKKKLNTAQVSHFCRQFSIIVSSGVNSVVGLETLGKRAPNPVLKEEIDRMVADIKVGSTIAETMQTPESKFPKLLASMVATGELTGKLDEVLKNMAVFYDKEYRIKQKIKSATTYPKMVCIVGSVMFLVFTSFIIPKMMESISEFGGETPLITKIVMWIGSFMSKYWLGVLIVGILVVMIISKYIKTPKGRERKDKLINMIPVLGKGINCIVSMRFARALNLFVSTGCPLLQGLEQMVEGVGNSLAEKALIKAKEGIIRGESLGENLEESNYFDPVLTQMISIGEETGELEVITRQMAEFYEQESDIYLNRIVSMIEPVLIVVIGAVVAVIVASVFLPMLSMYDAVH